MPGRPDIAERIFDFAGHDHVGRFDERTGGAQRGLLCIRAHCGIRIEVNDATQWHCRRDGVHVVGVVNPQQLLAGGERRLNVD